MKRRRNRGARKPINLHGQTLGRKGSDTRERLVDAAARLVHTRPLRQLRVSEIAATAGVSSASFYKYFESAEAAVLAAIEKHARFEPEVFAVLDADWPPNKVREHAMTFAAAYLDYWDRCFALLRVRNMAADEGDLRFVRMRLDAAEPVLQRLQGKIRAAQAAGKAPADVHAGAVAGFIVSSLERVLVGTRLEGRPSPVYTRQRLVSAAGFVIATILGEHEPL